MGGQTGVAAMTFDIAHSCCNHPPPHRYADFGGFILDTWEQEIVSWEENRAEPPGKVGEMANLSSHGPPGHRTFVAVRQKEGDDGG